MPSMNLDPQEADTMIYLVEAVSMLDLPADLKGLIVGARNAFHAQHGQQAQQLAAGQPMTWQLPAAQAACLYALVQNSFQPDDKTPAQLTALRTRILDELAAPAAPPGGEGGPAGG